MMSRLALVTAAALTLPLPSAAKTYFIEADVTVSIDPGFVSIDPDARAQMEVSSREGGNASSSGSGTTAYVPPEGANVAGTSLSLQATASGAYVGASSVSGLFVPIPLSFFPSQKISLPGEYIPDGYAAGSIYSTMIEWNLSGFIGLTSEIFNDTGTWAGAQISLRVLDTWTTDAQGDFMNAHQVVRGEAFGVESVRTTGARHNTGLIVSCGRSIAGPFDKTNQMELLYGALDEGRYQLRLDVAGASFGAHCTDNILDPPNGSGGGGGFAFGDFDEPLPIVPLPVSGWLLISGLAMIIGMRGRRCAGAA